jgi:predicted enzyme related to lactoylglutathione lyase
LVVKRIVVDVKAETVEEVRSFYSRLFGLQTVMDQGWIVTLASGEIAPVQISIASDGGSGTPVPDLSIEVDDVDAVYSKAKGLGCQITYDLTDEPWDVRRFFMIDPTGKTLNVLSHKA